jgi:hypothetical protein
MQYPMIAQPQYGFAPTMPMMPSMSDMPPGMMGQNMPQMNFKEGGIASLSLPEMAERVQDAGRGGDTMLAHITPEEAGILKLLGGSGTINPKTGQPEFIRKFLKRTPIVKEVYKGVSSIGKEIERGVESIAKDKILGPIAQMASYLHPVSAFLYAGLAPEGSSFDTKRAAKAAAMQQIGEYAVKQMQAQGAPGMEGTVGGPSGGGPSAGAQGPYGGTVGTNPNAPPSLTLTPAEVAAQATAAGGSSVTGSIPAPGADPYIFGSEGSDFSEVLTASASSSPPPPPPPASAPAAPPSITSGSAPPPSRAGAPAEIVNLSQASSTPLAGPPDPSGISGLAGAAGDIALSYGDDALNYALNNKVNTAFIANQIYAGMEAKKELDNQKEEAERILAAQEKHTQEEIAFAQDVLRRYPVEYRRLTAEDIKSQNLAGGGLAGLNAFKAGGDLNFLQGPGHGMSDDIPAMIGKQQKAALSDGEFVVPADVVSHLGNGSSRAGAKKLYSMMDNIRQARTGKKRQAPEVKPDRYMPA